MEVLVVVGWAVAVAAAMMMVKARVVADMGMGTGWEVGAAVEAAMAAEHTAGAYRMPA